MIFWEDVQGAFFEKRLAKLKTGETSSITHCSHTERGRVVLRVYKVGATNPYIIRNFNSEEEARSFVDRIN